MTTDRLPPFALPDQIKECFADIMNEAPADNMHLLSVLGTYVRLR